MSETATLPPETGTAPALTRQGASALGVNMSIPGMMQQRQRNAQERGALLEGAARQQGQAQEAQAQAGAEAMTARADTQRGNLEAYQRDMAPMPTAFIPTPETATDLATLFSLLAVAGGALGGKGKTSAMQAMGSMTGMMNGYRQGRADLYERERKTFDESLKAIQAHNQELRRIMEDVNKLAETDYNAAVARAQVEFARANSPILQQMAKAGSLEEMNKMIGDNMQMVNHLMDRQQRATQHAQQMQMQRDLSHDRIENERLRREAHYGETVGPTGVMLQRDLGITLNKDQVQQVDRNVASMGEAFALADEAARLPQNVGRAGQVRSFWEQYVTSARDAATGGRVVPPAELTEDERKRLSGSDQEALRFAKRYASFLTRYEQGLAGGARGFTVSFQNRMNALLAQNQFTPQGVVDLMRDMTREMGQNATLTGAPGLSYDYLAPKAIERYARSTYGADAAAAGRGAQLLGATSRGGQPGAPAAQATQIPQAALDMLKANPTDEARRQFDEVFGPDAAAKALGR